MTIDEELDAIHQAMDRLLDRILDANPQPRPAEWIRQGGATNAPEPARKPSCWSWAAGWP